MLFSLILPHFMLSYVAISYPLLFISHLALKCRPPISYLFYHSLYHIISYLILSCPTFFYLITLPYSMLSYLVLVLVHFILSFVILYYPIFIASSVIFSNCLFFHLISHFIFSYLVLYYPILCD